MRLALSSYLLYPCVLIVSGCGGPSQDDQALSAVREGKLSQLRNPSALVVKQLLHDSEVAGKLSDVWLIHLDLSAPEWSHLADLSKLAGLQSVHFFFTQNTDNLLEKLAENSTLQSLDFSDTDLTDAGLANVARLSTLQELKIEFTKKRITLEGLKKLKPLQIKEFHLASDTPIKSSRLRAIFPSCEITTDFIPSESFE